MLLALAAPARADCTAEFAAFAEVFLGGWHEDLSPAPLIEEAGGRCFLTIDDPDPTFAADWRLAPTGDVTTLDLKGATLPAGPGQWFARLIAIHDARAGTVRVEMATLYPPGGGLFDFRGTLSGIDLSSTTQAQLSLSGVTLEEAELTSDLPAPFPQLTNGVPALAEGITDGGGQAAWADFLAAHGAGRLTARIERAPRLPILPLFRTYLFGEAMTFSGPMLRDPVAWQAALDWTPAGAN
ncbi:hypothetical protein GCM10011392_36360 [Wenxinia marina]|nr:hypothetical protein GCM10011392_36360 [Wenxinia marina]